jgi:hypothetical protein
MIRGGSEATKIANGPSTANEQTALSVGSLFKHALPDIRKRFNGLASFAGGYFDYHRLTQ